MRILKRRLRMTAKKTTVKNPMRRLPKKMNLILKKMRRKEHKLRRALRLKAQRPKEALRLKARSLKKALRLRLRSLRKVLRLRKLRRPMKAQTRRLLKMNQKKELLRKIYF